MVDIDPHYLQAVLNVLNGSERPVRSFEYGELKIKFHSEEVETEGPQVAGFQPRGIPTAQDDNSPGAMHKRLMNGTVPELNPEPPKKSENDRS